MYLSCLLIDVGTNPDRPRPGRLWLRNRYRVHQRLCMAFPSGQRKTEDPDFLKPYNPQDFAHENVHVARQANAGFLFRIDPQPGGRAVILVQSANRPDWDYAFHNARYLLASRPDVRVFTPAFRPNQRLRFRLLANPTKRLRRDSRNAQDRPVDEQWVGKRVAVPVDGLGDWLSRRASLSGFRLADGPSIQPGYVYVNKNGDAAKGQRLRSVRYDGLLEVADVERFQETLIHGIGPGKAFGFGLLSVAPAG